MIGFGPIGWGNFKLAHNLEETHRLLHGITSVEWAVTKVGAIFLSVELNWTSKKEVSVLNSF